jgi:hypothetical protein
MMLHPQHHSNIDRSVVSYNSSSQGDFSNIRARRAKMLLLRRERELRNILRAANMTSRSDTASVASSASSSTSGDVDMVDA